MTKIYENKFYCEHCGHTLSFRKGITERVCNHCGHKTKNSLNIKEQTYITYLKMKQKRENKIFKKMAKVETPQPKIIREFVKEYEHFKLFAVFKETSSKKAYLYKTTELKVSNMYYEKELKKICIF